MAEMLLRRHLFTSYVLLLLIFGGLSGAFGVLAQQKTWIPEPWLLPSTLALFCVLSAGSFYWFIQRPFKKILREMKALLTGRPYHRVMTSKQDEVGVLAHFFNAANPGPIGWS